MSIAYKDYGFANSAESHMHAHFMPVVMQMAGDVGPGTRVLDVGSGNGFTCGIYSSAVSLWVGHGRQGATFALNERRLLLGANTPTIQRMPRFAIYE